MTLTLKELITNSKIYDNNMEIYVYVSSSVDDNKRKTVVFNPDSDSFIDRHAMYAYDDCYVTEVYRHTYGYKKHMLIVFVDLDMQYMNLDVTFNYGSDMK